jgi:hypothetical protein
LGWGCFRCSWRWRGTCHTRFIAASCSLLHPDQALACDHAAMDL